MFIAASILGHTLFLSGGVIGGKLNSALITKQNVFKVHSIGGSVTVIIV